ncbi:MAG: hypothetical protein JNJ54_18620 [Myxococcaceae bacterium]|nr:hypothetical protein [Myxococcaceae bacterium]
MKKDVQRALAADAAMAAEINREKASSLGRTGRVIEEAIAACAALRKKLEPCPPGPKRRELVKEYAAQRKIVVEQRWNLEVQREAMGLRKHTDLDTFFPIPPVVRE